MTSEEFKQQVIKKAEEMGIPSAISEHLNIPMGGDYVSVLSEIKESMGGGASDGETTKKAVSSFVDELPDKTDTMPHCKTYGLL